MPNDTSQELGRNEIEDEVWSGTADDPDRAENASARTDRNAVLDDRHPLQPGTAADRHVRADDDVVADLGSLVNDDRKARITEHHVLSHFGARRQHDSEQDAVEDVDQARQERNAEQVQLARDPEKVNHRDSSNSIRCLRTLPDSRTRRPRIGARGSAMP